MSELINKVDFNFIRYANCWEDADILTEALTLPNQGKILSIASAGDNSFSLLTLNPEVVVAVDVNTIQLHLVNLKKLCIQRLEREEVLAFLGFTPSDNRKAIYNKLATELNSTSKHFFDTNIDSIEKGIIHTGKFEKYFQLFAWKLLPFIHNKKRVAELFRSKTAEEQKVFYDNSWNTWRWRLLFKIFFSKRVMGKHGRDPEFLKQVNLTVSDYIFSKAEQELSNVKAQNNFFLYYNLNGNFGSFLPHYLQEENYKTVKNNLAALQTHEGYAQDAIAKYGKFRAMNLSNIFEYMDTTLFAETANALVKGTESGGRLAYWNLMVPRRISAIISDNANHLDQLSKKLTAIDKGFFYNCFTVDEVK